MFEVSNKTFKKLLNIISSQSAGSNYLVLGAIQVLLLCQQQTKATQKCFFKVAPYQKRQPHQVFYIEFIDQNSKIFHLTKFLV